MNGELGRQPVDLVDAIDAVGRDLGLVGDGHRLVVDLSPDLPLVDADERLLHHVLVNLFDNAIRFTPPDGRIWITGRVREGVELAIADEGEGLPTGEEDAIFERFTRVSGGDRQGGTGLGLAIVRSFCAAMGATVSARNGERGGAVFTLHWPLDHVRPPIGTSE